MFSFIDSRKVKDAAFTPLCRNTTLQKRRSVETLLLHHSAETPLLCRSAETPLLRHSADPKTQPCVEGSQKPAVLAPAQKLAFLQLPRTCAFKTLTCAALLKTYRKPSQKLAFLQLLRSSE